MEKVTFKRVAAYIFDLMIVMCIASVFSQIDLINPTKDKKEELSKKYTEISEKYVTAYNDGQTEELKSLETEANDIGYEMTKCNVPTSIITIVVTLLYFVAFQYFNKGQTLGMKILRIKVCNDKMQVPSIIQLLSRSLIINSVITSTLSIAILSLCSKSIYLTYGSYIVILDGLLIIGSLFFMMFRSDGKGLHDLFANTNVYSTKNTNTDVKEATYTEKNKSSKKIK